MAAMHSPFMSHNSITAGIAAQYVPTNGIAANMAARAEKIKINEKLWKTIGNQNCIQNLQIY